MDPMPTIETSQKTDVIISTLHRAKLVARLKARAELQAQLAALEHALKKNTDEIEQVRAEIGEKAFSIEGHKISRIEGVYRSFDKKQYVTLGGDLRLYEQAMVEKPRKAYTKVTMPGEREPDYERD
jgi:hypothetical protein